MLASKPELPPFFRTVNWLGQKLRAERWAVARLDEEALHAIAMKETGLADFGDPYYREGLARLLHSAHHDADLHLVGRIGLQGLIAIYLANRLLLTHHRRENPALFEQPLRPPLIVLGMPRSGTTFLHRLLATDPAVRAAPFWELMRPVPPIQGQDRRRQTAVRDLKIRSMINRNLDRKHYLRADSAEECMWALGLTFTGLVFWVTAPVYGYLDWYLQADRENKYREYRQILQILQAVDPGKRLVLKAPAHAGALAELRRHVPEALIVRTHRDPVAIVSSMNSLFYTTHSASTRHLDVRRMAGANVRLLKTELARAQIALDEKPGQQLLDVDYARLVTDPVQTVEKIYRHFGLPWEPAHAGRLQAHLQANPQAKYGRHRYRAADFGLTEETIAYEFADYRADFML